GITNATRTCSLTVRRAPCALPRASPVVAEAQSTTDDTRARRNAQRLVTATGRGRAVRAAARASRLAAMCLGDLAGRRFPRPERSGTARRGLLLVSLLATDAHGIRPCGEADPLSALGAAEHARLRASAMHVDRETGGSGFSADHFQNHLQERRTVS